MNPASKKLLAPAGLAGAMLAISAAASAQEPDPIAAVPLTERHAFPR